VFEFLQFFFTFSSAAVALVVLIVGIVLWRYRYMDLVQQSPLGPFFCPWNRSSPRLRGDSRPAKTLQ
jgi:hypothetical protein